MGFFAHAQTVDTRPFFPPLTWPGYEASQHYTCTCILEVWWSPKAFFVRDIHNTILQLAVLHSVADTYVAVPGRNQTLFCCAIELWSTVRKTSVKGGAHMHSKVARIPDNSTSYIWALPLMEVLCYMQRFKCSNAVKIRNRIMLDFYPGLPHIKFHLHATGLVCETHFYRNVPDLPGTSLRVVSFITPSPACS